MSKDYEINVENSDYGDKKRENKQRIVRNEFKGVGKYGMPLIKKTRYRLG